MRFCPKCDEDISDSYQGQEVDVGIMSGGWYCEKCEVYISEEDENHDDD